MQKRKLRNPPLRIKAPSGTDCHACHGTGVHKGALYEDICASCGGLGLLDVKDEHITSLEDALAYRLIETRRDLEELKRFCAKNAKEQHIGSPFD